MPVNKFACVISLLSVFFFFNFPLRNMTVILAHSSTYTGGLEKCRTWYKCIRVAWFHIVLIVPRAQSDMSRFVTLYGSSSQFAQRGMISE